MWSRMKAKEVLEKLNITRPTLTKYVKTGVIKVDNKVNGQYIYNDESVYNFLGLTTNNENIPGTKTIHMNYETPRITSMSEMAIDQLIKVLENDIVILTQLGQLRLLQPNSVEKLRENKKILNDLKEFRKNE